MGLDWNLEIRHYRLHARLRTPQYQTRTLRAPLCQVPRSCLFAYRLSHQYQLKPNHTNLSTFNFLGFSAPDLLLSRKQTQDPFVPGLFRSDSARDSLCFLSLCSILVALTTCHVEIEQSSMVVFFNLSFCHPVRQLYHSVPKSHQQFSSFDFKRKVKIKHWNRNDLNPKTSK